MAFPLPMSALILSLAIGYLVVVYGVLWWAKRTDKPSKRV